MVRGNDLVKEKHLVGKEKKINSRNQHLSSWLSCLPAAGNWVCLTCSKIEAVVNSCISSPPSKTAELNWTSNATGWQWHVHTNLKSLLILSSCLLAESHASTPKNLKHSREGAGNPGKERSHPHVRAESKIKMHHFASSKRTCLVQKCQVPTLPSVRTNLPKSYFCFLTQCSSLIFFLYYFIGFRWPTACDEWSSWSELKTEFAISQLINTFYLHLLWKKHLHYRE